MVQNIEKAMKKEQFRETGNTGYTRQAFEIGSVQFKDYINGICCFSANYASLRRKITKDGLA
jgi:hypothetical protein